MGALGLFRLLLAAEGALAVVAFRSLPIQRLRMME
jgi:hypothetical protein